jgi:hypothetical protein
MNLIYSGDLAAAWRWTLRELTYRAAAITFAQTILPFKKSRVHVTKQGEGIKVGRNKHLCLVSAYFC